MALGDNTDQLKPKENDRHFSDNIFKYISLRGLYLDPGSTVFVPIRAQLTVGPLYVKLPSQTWRSSLRNLFILVELSI